MVRILRAAAYLLLAGASAGSLGATTAADPEALAEEIRRGLPEQVVVDRWVTTPHHVVLGGHVVAGQEADLGEVADLVDALDRILPFEEPQVRWIERSERGLDFSVTVPLSKAGRPESPSEPLMSPIAKLFQNLGWWLLEPQPPYSSVQDPSPEEPWKPAPAVTRPEAGNAFEIGDLEIREVAVREIYRTSVGGVARIHARGRHFLIRKGDRLADGDVGNIGFFTPQIAWVKLRRRVTGHPGVPYRPVVWILSSDAPQPTREGQELLALDGMPGPAIGPRWNRRIEARVLTAEPTGRNALPPWTWVVTVEEAPRFFVAVLEAVRPGADAFEAFAWLGPSSDEDGLSISFGSLRFEIPFTSRESMARAIADELGVPVPRLSFHRKDKPSKKHGPSRQDADLDEILGEALLYDPGERRDPFHDLTGFSEPKDRGPRPEGIPGLMIDDIAVDAVFETPKGLLAEVCTHGRCYFVHEGAELWDGEVERIDLARGVLFRQMIQDPTAVWPFQWLRKKADLRGLDAAEPAGPRDPFHALVEDEEPPPPLPSALSGLTCEDLTYLDAERLRESLVQAESRLAVYRWERRLADEHLEDGARPGVQPYLRDIAQTLAFDLARRFGHVRERYSLEDPPLRSLLEVERPPPTEMVSLLGDLELVVGRPGAAVEAYRQAQILSPEYEPLCGRLHDGKLYGVENRANSLSLTGYLLAWDPDTGRVSERHLLPGLPARVQADGEALRLSIPRSHLQSKSVRVFRSRLDPPVRWTWGHMTRLYAVVNGRQLASNFVRRDGWKLTSFEVGQVFDERLSVTLEELEQALRAAAIQDPTQPWHPFWLGQALWAQERHDAAEAVWNDLWQTGLSSLPFNEVSAMAAYHLAYGQPDWADRTFDLAVEKRHCLSPSDEKQIWRFLDAGSWVIGRIPDDRERLYSWWLRVREISSEPAQDPYIAALWADFFARKGDRAREREALEILRQERDEFPAFALAIIYFFLSLYLLAGVVAMVFARLTILASRLRWRRLPRPRWPGWRHLRGLDLLALVLALQLALSLTVFAASYMDYLYGLDETDWLREEGSEIQRLTRGELVGVWLTQGYVEPAVEPPSLVVSALQSLRSRGLDYRVSLVLALTLVLFVLALPIGQLLRWGRLRRLVAITVPGASHVRTGARLRGPVLFGLFVFSALALTWLGVARLHSNPEPLATGGWLSPGLWAPPPPEGSSSSEDSDADRLRAASFWRLLTLYPGAGLFWTLVFAALVVSVGSHVEAVRKARGRPGRGS